MSLGRATVLVTALTASCDSANREPEPHPLCVARPELCVSQAVTPAFSAPVVVAPSAMLPPEVVSQDAHNNLDAAWHEAPAELGGPRLFFAFRTAPTHFASPDTVMWIVSSADLSHWRYEGMVAIGTDVREPQFVSVKGKLLFYFTELGDNPFEFEPHGTRVMEWLGPGQMSAPEPIFDPGFLTWRTKPMAARGADAGEWVYAFGYGGGDNIYDNDGEPIRVFWMRSRDGRAFEPVDPAHPVVLEGGASETDAVFRDDGSVVAVARNEAGDASGFGSKICRGEADAIGAWTCASDRRKFDSPLVFRGRGTDVWLVARRNVTSDGYYDLGRDDLPMNERYVEYQRAYWLAPKRTSLWRVDGDALTVTWVLDLPSRGDTCFPEIVELAPGLGLLFNYSSPWPAPGEPETPDIGWVTGQSNPTMIYYTALTF